MSGPEPGPQPDARVDRPLSEPAEFNESEFRAQLLQYVIQTESAMNNTRKIHRVHGDVLYGDVSFALEKLKQARQDDPVYRGLSLRKIIDVTYQSPQHSDPDKQRIITCTIDQLASQLTVFVSLQTIIKSAIERMTPDQRAYYAPLESVVTSIQTKMDTGWYQVTDYADQIDNAMAIAQEAHFDFRDALLQMGILEQSSG